MDEMQQLLIMAVMIVGFIVIVLVGVLVIMSIKNKQKEDKIKNTNIQSDVTGKSYVQQNYSVLSIMDFMEFDKIEDNMIIMNKGKKFLMVVKCQGVNYDLMSELEKTSVEQGFLQYLNTLRHQIQIYVQTRTVDLGNSINEYKEKINKLRSDLAKKELEYNQMLKDDNYSKEQLFTAQKELAKARNLYEYGADIVMNTERMNLNKNILSKQYYIIIPYYADEIGIGDYSKDEIQSMAFSELYTRAQSTISLLSVCSINGKILDSVELANLLYMAYNRDEAELYNLQKAINARYDEMYTTAPDVLDKKIKILDKQIEEEAYKKANDAVLEVRQERKKEKELKQKEQEYENAIDTLAKMILEQNKLSIGIKTAEMAKEKIEKKEDDSNEKEVVANEEKKATRKPGRPRKRA